MNGKKEIPATTNEIPIRFGIYPTITPEIPYTINKSILSDHPVDENPSKDPLFKSPVPPPLAEATISANSPLEIKVPQSIEGSSKEPTLDNLTNVQSNTLEASKSKVAIRFEHHKSMLFPKVNSLPCASFPVEAKKHLIDKMKYVVIAKFSHGRPTYRNFMAFLAKRKFSGLFGVSAFDLKHIFVEFVCFEDYVKLWTLKTCMVSSFRVRFFTWTESFSPNVESSIAPVWIFLPGLPLYLLEECALIEIASALGKPLFIDPSNISHKKVGSAWFCVAVDANHTQPDEMWIEFVDDKGSGDRFKQKVNFFDMPLFCNSCNHIGHAVPTCKKLLRNSGKNNQIRQGDPIPKTNDLEEGEIEVIIHGEKGAGRTELARNSKGECFQYKQDSAPDNNKQRCEVDMGISDTAPPYTMSERAPTGPTATDLAKGNSGLAQSEAESMNVLHNFVVGCVSLNQSPHSQIAEDDKRTNKKAVFTKGSNGEELLSADKLDNRPADQAAAGRIELAETDLDAATNQPCCFDGLSVVQGPVSMDRGAGRPHTHSATAPKSGKEKQTPPSRHDTAEKNIPMDYSIPPFQNCTDVLVEEIEDEEDESSEGSEVQSSDDELDLDQKLEKFEKVCKDLLNIKNTRIIYKKHVLPDIERGWYSEEEEAEMNPVDFNLDPLMGKDDEIVRFSRLTESRAKLVCQRSVSPVGRSSTKLKYLKTKLGHLALQRKFAILMSTDKYERTQKIKDTRHVRRTEKEWTTPKRRGRPPKTQNNPHPQNQRTSPQNAQQPRKRGRPKKKV